MTIVCERSFAERVRSSVLTLMYDDNHKCNITISQEAAPSSADKLIKVIGGEATSEETQGKDTDQNPLTLKMSYDGNKKHILIPRLGRSHIHFLSDMNWRRGIH